MKPPVFDYVTPGSVDEALDALGSTDGEETKVLAGGQSLLPLLNLRLAHPARLVDLSRVEGLDRIALADGVLTVGALVRQRTAERSAEVRAGCPLMAQAIPLIGHAAIRNRGTVGGSIAHADSAAELPTVVVCLDAELVAQGPGGTRTVPAAEFFTGFFGTALSEDEILTAVRIRAAEPHTGSAYEEVARRHGDFAMVGVAAVVRLDGDAVAEARIAISGVGTAPVRARAAEAGLVGGPATEDRFVAAAAAATADITPGSDLHASAAYRRQLCGVLVERALHTATSRARESR